MNTTFKEFVEDWIFEFYDELEDLEKYSEEENLLMVGSTIDELRDLLDEYEEAFIHYMREVING